MGPAAGAQMSWVRLSEEDDRNLYHSRPVYGYHAGVSVAFRVRERFFLHTSLLYSRKGKIIEGKQDRLLRNEVRHNYIELPFVYMMDFRGKLGSGRQFKYAFGVGPNVSYWIGGRGTLANTELSETGIGEKQYRIVFGKDLNTVGDHEMGVMDPNRIQLGLNFAANLTIEPQPNQKVLLRVRYHLGHSFFARTPHGEFTGTYYGDVLRAQDRSITLSAIFLLDLELEKRRKGKSTISR